MCNTTLLRRLALFTLALCVCCAGRSASAQTSFPMLGSVFPVSVQRGKTTEVTVSTGGNGGGNIYGAYKALFEGEGIKAEAVVPEKGWPARDPKTPNTVPQVGEVKLRVTVTADAPLGVREFRLGTPHHGISSVGQIVISDEPQVTEVEPNNEAAQAQAVTLPCVVNGKFQAGEDVDTYKFKVEAGQEVVFAVQCARLQDKIHDLQDHADPMLVLRDASGKELNRNDDYYRADPLLHYKFEKAGEYFLQIRDVKYGGNPHWVYALTMTMRPYVTGVVPCAVRPGQSNELRVTGFNLGGAKSVRLDVPGTAPRGVWTAQLKLPGGLSNAVPLLVSDVPQLVNESKAAAAGSKTITASLSSTNIAPASLRLPLPGGVSSLLEKSGQIDRYTFAAKKGSKWAFEVTARRLDSEMDSEIKLRDAKGNVLAANDDAIGKDSRLDLWEAPADGDYTIDVRDLTGGAGPNVFYNLTATAVHPDFALRCDTDRAMIAPGNRTCWYVFVDRKYGFAGPVTVEIKGLPAGVTATPLTVPPALGQGVVFLMAAPDAKIDTANVQVIGTGKIKDEKGQEVMASHGAAPLTEIYMPGGGRGLLPVETQGISVTDTNDIEVSANMQEVTLAPGGTIKIEVTVKRRPDYTKPITLEMRVKHLDSIYTNPLPPGVVIDEGASKTLLNDNETKGHIVLKVNGDAPPIEKWPIAIIGNVSINFVMKVWYAAPPISLTVTSAKK